MRSRRYGADHGRAQEHRFRRLGRLDRLAAHIGDDLADQRAPRRAAADDDRIELVTGPLELANNVGEAIGETAEAGDMKLLQARSVFAQVHPQDAPARPRIGQGRSAADEIRQDMQALGDQSRLRQTARAGHDVLLQRRQRTRSGALRQRGERRMRPQEMIDRGAERRLSAIDEPLIGSQRREMRSPYAVDELRLVRERHAARRGAEDQRQAPARIDRPPSPARAQRARGARVGVDQPRADGSSRPQAHRGRGLGGQTPAKRRARRRRMSANEGVVVASEEAKTHAVEEFVRPSFFLPEIAELAGRRAGRADERAGRPVRQEIGEVEEMPSLGDHFGLPSGEPCKFGHMHLRRNQAAHVTQRRMSAGVDPVSVGGGSMIHPYDHVALGRSGRAHRQGTRVAVERDQRAGGVEAHAGYRPGQQT